MTQDTSKSSQEARKRSPRGRQVAPRGSQGTPIGLPELSKKSNRASLSLCNHFAFFAFTDFQNKTTHPQYIQAWPGGMRVAFESAAPKRRPGLELQTPAELAGVFRPPPCQGMRIPPGDHPTCVHLASDYHPTDPYGALGGPWTALGALLWRSWTMSAA